MSSGDLDILPKPEAPADLCHFGARPFVLPRGAFVALALDNHVVELHAVRAGKVACRLLGLLQPIHAHGALRKVLVAVAGDDVVALCDDVSVDTGFHGRTSFDATSTRL